MKWGGKCFVGLSKGPISSLSKRTSPSLGDVCIGRRIKKIFPGPVIFELNLAVQVGVWQARECKGTGRSVILQTENRSVKNKLGKHLSNMALESPEA